MKLPFSIALLLGLLAACDRSAAEAGKKGLPALVRSAGATELPSAQAPAPVASPAPSSWADALRREDWKGAAQQLDALGAELAKRAELRYARARVALELGEHPKAIELLRGLEAELPELAERIRRARAEAELVAGPHESAAQYFEAQRDASSLLDAALAYRRAKRADKARALFERALSAAERGGSRMRELLSRVRAERAAFFEEQGDKARAVLDLRWLALEAPRTRAAKDADTRVTALNAKRALTKAERAGRLFAFAEGGMVDAVEEEIKKLGATPGPALGRAKLDLARGLALYNARRDYLRAAELLTAAAKNGAPEPAKASFYAARSHARAHDDARAIALYGELTRRYPKTSWAETASYLMGKTHYAGGNFAAATKALDAYLAKYGKRARYGKEAAFERATSLLASGSFAEAARAYVQLRASARDAREKARLLELEGAARAGAGEREAAVKLFREAIDEQPLSFAALVAKTRLERLGVQAPPLLGSAAAPPVVPEPVSPDLPKAVALLAELGLDREAESELRPREAEIEGKHAGRSNEALCRAYGKLDVAARRYQIGQNVVSASILKTAPTPATLWQWDCLYPRPHELIVREVSKNKGVAEALVWGIMRQESGFRPDVISPANAVGLMQLIPPTAERVAKELNLPYDHGSLNSPAYNVKLGSHYLKKLLDFFGGNVALAAAGYNAGPQAVFRWLERAGDLPLDVFVARIPYDETQKYVERVVGNLARYRYVEEGEAGIPKLSLELPRDLKAPPDLY